MPYTIIIENKAQKEFLKLSPPHDNPLVVKIPNNQDKRKQANGYWQDDSILDWVHKALDTIAISKVK